MLFEHRAERIIDLLSEKSTVTIQEFVASLGVSESTIRRDLIALEEKGQLRRIHGGATTVTDLGKEQKMAQRVSINQDAKRAVAEYAKTLVKPDSQIYVDAGTATLELIQQLPTNQYLHIVTNGVDHALAAVEKELNVTIIGGAVKPNTHAIAGMQAYEQLSKMNFTHAFMGMNGIHPQSGLTTTNIDEATLKELAMKQSQNIRVLMDDTKVGQVFEYKVEVPTQAIILLNEKANTHYEKMLEEISEEYDIHFVGENDAEGIR